MTYSDSEIREFYLEEIEGSQFDVFDGSSGYSNVSKSWLRYQNVVRINENREIENITRDFKYVWEADHSDLRHLSSILMPGEEDIVGEDYLDSLTSRQRALRRFLRLLRNDRERWALRLQDFRGTTEFERSLYGVFWTNDELNNTRRELRKRFISYYHGVYLLRDEIREELGENGVEIIESNVFRGLNRETVAMQLNTTVYRVRKCRKWNKEQKAKREEQEKRAVVIHS